MVYYVLAYEQEAQYVSEMHGVGMCMYASFN